MIAELLEKREPLVYASLKNDLRNGHLSHTYLLAGEKDVLKIEAAFLLAQSIIENRHDFACEECQTCNRIRNNNYYDLIYVDGYESLIKKDDIEHIMEEFSKTALEAGGKKVYILANINNSTDKVLNMLLKFMEEPSSRDVYGIFITDDKDKLLETVLSRCQILNFKSHDYEAIIKEYENRGFEKADSYFLSYFYREFRELSLNDGPYISARECVYQFIDNLADVEYLPLMFNDYYNNTGKDDFRLSSDYFFFMILRMLEDAISGHYLNDEAYDKRLDELRKHDLAFLFNIFEDAYEKSFSPTNRQLLFDQISYKIIS